MIALLLTWVALQSTPEPVFSGPQPGEGTPGFTVLALNGPQRGQKVDYIQRWGPRPSLFIFLHEVSRPAGRLVKLLDGLGHERSGRLSTLLVTLNDDTLDGELEIPRTLESLKFQSVCGVSVDGKEGPGAWGLNRDMAVTVILARDGKVLSNWALANPNETDFEAIRAEVDEALIPRLDTLEDLRAEFLIQQAQLDELRSEVAALRAQLAARGDAVLSPASDARNAPGSPGTRGTSQGRGEPGRGQGRGGMGSQGMSLDDTSGAGQDRAGRQGGTGTGGMSPASGARNAKARGAQASQDELMQYIKPLADVSASTEQVEAAILALDAYIAGDPQRAKRTARAIQQLEDRGRGNDASRAARAKYLESSADDPDSASSSNEGSGPSKRSSDGQR